MFVVLQGDVWLERDNSFAIDITRGYDSSDEEGKVASLGVF